jgi:hypothetical protein
MRKSLRKIGLIILIILSVGCFLYLNYFQGLGEFSEFSLGSELTDVKISKFILETLKKVAINTF